MATHQAQFKEWLDKISAGIKDGVTLDVTTFSGNVSGMFETSGETFAFKKEKLPALIAAQTNGVYMVAHTHQEVDYDTMLFVKDNLTEEQQKLVEMHNSAVKAASDARSAFVKAVIGMF